MKIFATREHEFSYGHRVHEHECKCKHLHGHNGKFVFHCYAEQLDSVGRVIDFSVMKELLCEWVESNWDHRFLYGDDDIIIKRMLDACKKGMVDGVPAFLIGPSFTTITDSFVAVPFNPTAENICNHMLHVVGPMLLAGTGVTLVKVELYETSKCRAIAEL